MRLSLYLARHSGIYRTQNAQSALLCGFYPVHKENIGFELICFINAAKGFQRVDDFIGLCIGNELGRSDALRKDLQIVNMELTRGKTISAALTAFDIHSVVVPQGRNIAVDAAAIRGNGAFIFQKIDDISCADSMVFIRIFQKILRHI